jgi:hypothetical protein
MSKRERNQTDVKQYGECQEEFLVRFENEPLRLVELRSEDLRFVYYCGDMECSRRVLACDLGNDDTLTWQKICPKK